LFSPRSYSSGEKDSTPSHSGSFLKKEEVSERVINVIKQHSRLGVAPEQIAASSHFANDLKLDSLDTTEVDLLIFDF
jgi:predicted hydrolase (HD superfamily)